MTAAARTVVLLGPHPSSSHSMRLHADVLERAYRALGVRVRVLSPPSRLSRRVRDRRLRKLAVYAENLIAFPAVLWSRVGRDELVHVTDHSDAPWLLALRRRRGATVVTCHDLMAIRAAIGQISEYRPRLPGRLYQGLIRHGLSRADRIVAVSRATSTDVGRLLPGIPRTVIRLPVPPVLASPSGAGTRPERAFALVVSSAGWRKRRERAVQAVASIVVDRDLDLVVVGEPLTEEEVASIPGEYHDALAGRLFVRQDLLPADLAGLYAGCEFLLQLSLYEGYAWPVLECNAFGRVAICSDRPVFTEMSPSNVFVADPLREVDWRRAADEAVDPGRRTRVAADATRMTLERFADELRPLLMCEPRGRI